MSSSVGHQMPALYLRGSLCNETMKKKIKKEDLESLNEIVISVANDPLLQPCRIQFRNALKYTIGGDYKSDQDSADQEYIVAIWRAAVAAKYGWGTHQPSPNTITDKIQRKKFFQTWVFNYLRQILQENKINTIKYEESIQNPVYDHIKEEILNKINGFNHKVLEKYYGNLYIQCDFNVLPLSIILSINEIINKYSQYSLEINYSDNSLEIISLFELAKFELGGITNSNINGIDNNTAIIHHPNFNDNVKQLIFNLSNKYLNKLTVIINDGNDIVINTKNNTIEKTIIKNVKVTVSSIHTDDNNNKTQEIEDMDDNKNISSDDGIKLFYDRLSDNAKKVHDIIVKTPTQYITKYNTDKPVRKYIADYLGLDNKEINDIYTEMRIKYVETIGNTNTKD